MAYTPTNWSDEITPLNASNMNKIEEAIESQAETLDTLTASSSTMNIFSEGQSIPTESDLNDYITPGNYRVQSTATATTIVNAPTTTIGYRFFVFYNAANNRYIQIAITNTAVPAIYIRNYASTGWGNWYSFNVEKTQ